MNVSTGTEGSVPLEVFVLGSVSTGAMRGTNDLPRNCGMDGCERGVEKGAERDDVCSVDGGVCGMGVSWEGGGAVWVS